MTEIRDRYETPLGARYGSKEMSFIFSSDRKFSTWRRLWVALAKAENALGVEEVTLEKIAELEAHVTDINYDVAEAREKEVRHDVMSHVYAYGQQCPNAAGIIHYGATSCFVTDNTDLLNLKDACQLIKKRLLGVMKLVADSALANKEVCCLGYTHFQPASPTTIGKRETLWLQDLYMAYTMLESAMKQIKLLGCRGATGTSSTFMKIFDRDESKVKKLDVMIAEEFGFDGKDVFDVSGQTYPRLLDAIILNALQVIDAAVYKMCCDIRHMAHDKEAEEPFAKGQIGSSAMAYKRNPMRCERADSLALKGIIESLNAPLISATQWMERTLDDSANRRMSIPESFLLTDEVLILAGNVVDGMVLNKAIIQKRLMEELPFMVTENIMMAAVKKGGDRQELHERIRQCSRDAGQRVKQEGKDNNMLELIAADPMFNMSIEEVTAECDPTNLIGRAPNQVEDFIMSKIIPILDENADALTEVNTSVSV